MTKYLKAKTLLLYSAKLCKTYVYLQIPPSWKNATNYYRLGVKHAYDLYPEKTKERIKDEYKEKKWESPHKLASAEAVRNLVKLDAVFSGTNSCQ